MGSSRRPDGHELSVDNRSLLRDGQPWLPVSGEFHFSRSPASEWRNELLKIKAGGIAILATYVFWIHHEELEGRWHWSGQRDLRRFVELCGEIGLLVMARCGPWCHGETRNGGLPEWLVERRHIRLRSNDPQYLEKARILYAQIARQLSGLLWKDGGPVIGIQVENEYGGPAEHLLALKAMARASGLDVPFYTRTGWPELSTPLPQGELLPLFGAYAEGFWDRELTPMPGNYPHNFRFRLTRVDAAVAVEQLGEREVRDPEEVSAYPYFCCEIGGGMASSYHRRILLSPQDVEAVAMVKLGSGNNLQGYYMYHGGTNPQGALTTLQESQNSTLTNWNDLPVQSYDFHAPIGEFGQLNPHYHRLRRTHEFLREFGALLATYPAYLPQELPAGPRDAQTLRWSVRSDGEHGFLFVSHYQRLQTMSARPDMQFGVQLKSGTLLIPSEPVRVPEDSIFFWPFNFDLDGINLSYATAQPICRLRDEEASYYLFAQTPGVIAEFVFDDGVRLESTTGQIVHQTVDEEERTQIRVPAPGTGEAIRLRASDGRAIIVVLLSEEQSLQIYKARFAGRERIFLSRAGLWVDGDDLHDDSRDALHNELHLATENPADLTFAVLPAPATFFANGHKVEGIPDGLFLRFAAPSSGAQPVEIAVEPVRPAGPAPAVRLGVQGVAAPPFEEAFAEAAVWRIVFPADVIISRDLLLRIRYVGDVARLYAGETLLADNFYNGRAFEVGLKRYASALAHQELLLKILPLRRDAPILLPTEAKPDFAHAGSALALHGIDVVERRELQFTATVRTLGDEF